MKRIMVAVDASPKSLATLEMAAELAAQMRARLETLFVEDVNLLRLAELPFATELVRSSGQARNLTESALTHALQIRARRLGQLLQTFSEQKQVKTNLRIVRGNYVTEAMHAEADVLFLFTSTRVSMMSVQKSRPKDMRPTLYNVAPIYVYYPGGQETERALLLASDLAETLGTGIVVLLPASNKSSISGLKKRSLKMLGDARPIRYQVIDTDLANSIQKIAARDCSLIVMSKQDAKTQLVEINALESIHCPLVLVA